MSVSIGKYIAQADEALTKLDRASIARLQKIIQSEYNALEAKLRKLYNEAEGEVRTQSSVYREARARLMLEQLEDLLLVLAATEANKVIGNHISDVIRSETEEVHQLLSAFGATLSTRIPAETVATVVSNISDNLAHHGKQFALEAEEVVVRGLVNGQGFGKMASELRKKSGVLMWRAEMIVRTETMQASDMVRRASYQKNDVPYVMRIATQDSRVCGHCLARAGNVYRVEDAPQSLHPNDRCYNAPFKPEWLELGLIDAEWVLSHRIDAEKRSEDKPRTGAAPFEKAAGREPPKPIWTPRGGYTEHR